MPIHNSDIADMFERVAELLEMKDANPFRIRAYRNAARTIGSLSKNVAEMVGAGDSLQDLPGIGKDLAGKITEIVETGKLAKLEELQKEIPADVLEILRVPGLGPKKVKALYQTLEITSVEDLRTAAQEHRIRALNGFGEKTEERILRELDRMSTQDKRISLLTAEEVASSLVVHLRKSKGVHGVAVAGSFRRRKETVGDLDILVTCKKGSQVMARFLDYEDVREVVSRGETRSSVVLRSGLQVDLRVVPQVSYGAALHYFTGSQAHNIAIRKLGIQRDLKINEYGVYRGKKRIGGKTEQEVYRRVGLPYIEPELREDRGEIQAAQRGKLPQLVTEEDIRGDLHSHTTATDGRHTLEELVSAARKRGYEYLAISNHSKHVTVARGLDPKRLAKQIEEVDRLNEKVKGFRVLKAIEVDILGDGSLDLPNSVLKELDFTVGSIHSQFDFPEKKQTERIIRAMDNPYFTILGHPTGRLINRRQPYAVDMERVMGAAKERGCFMELNAQPDRLDLNDIHCKMARDMGIKVAISTDAHRIGDLEWMRFGVGQARRGWLEADDVLNTRGARELIRLFRRR